jgi:hypothetical protein
VRVPELSRAQLFVELDPTAPSGLKWACSFTNVKAGQPAGWKDAQGYHRLQFDGVTYFCHHLVLLLNGLRPPCDCNEVDHVDRNPSNNSIQNLRWVNRSRNIANRAPMGRIPLRYVSTAGRRLKAQYRHPATKRKIHVGTFDDPQKAYAEALAHRLENHWIDHEYSN